MSVLSAVVIVEAAVAVIAPVTSIPVAVRACAAIVLPDSAVNVLAVITKSLAPAT